MIKLLKTISHSAAIILIFILQYSFIEVLDEGFNQVNLPLIVLLSLSGRNKFVLAFYYALGFGLLGDIISPLPFGIMLLTYFLIFVIIYFILEKFLARRSLATFMATSLISLILFLLIKFYSYAAFNLVETSLVDNWRLFLIYLATNLTSLALIYLFIQYLKLKQRDSSRKKI